MFTPFLGTVVYAFAAILGLYLSATYIGSLVYRRLGGFTGEGRVLWALAGLTGLLPLVAVDPRVPIPALIRVAIGIMPFAGCVGFTTPLLVDYVSSSQPDLAGKAYAVNVAGCITGPLVAGFLLLPTIGERFAICLLSLPWFFVGFRLHDSPETGYAGRIRDRVAYLFLTIGILFVVFTKGYEEQFKITTFGAITRLLRLQRVSQGLGSDFS